MAQVIDYIELAVDDLEQSKAFYAKALGWAFNDYGPDYAGIQDPTTGGEFGGLDATPVASRGEAVLALVRTDDVDAALASVLAAGGRDQSAMTTIRAGGGSRSPTPPGTSSGSTSRPNSGRQAVGLGRLHALEKRQRRLPSCGSSSTCTAGVPTILPRRLFVRCALSRCE